MSYELNLTDDQERHIEEAESPEEKVTVIKEAVGAGRELSDDELDSMSGGVRIPRTHELIDAEWDAIQIVANKFDKDTALVLAYERGLIPSDLTPDGFSYLETKRSISEMRAWMHRELDGKNDKLTSIWGI